MNLSYENLKPYEEAFKAASGRTRTTLYLTLATGILLLVAFLKFGPGNWYDAKAETYANLATQLDKRLQARVHTQTRDLEGKSQEYVETAEDRDLVVSGKEASLGPKWHPPMGQSSNDDLLLAQKYAGYAEGAIAKKIAASELDIPLIPVKISEEDIGLLGSILLVIFSSLVLAALRHEVAILRKTGKQFTEPNKAEPELKWKDVLGIGHPLYEANRMTAIISESVLFLPLLVQTLILCDAPVHLHRPIHSEGRFWIGVGVQAVSICLLAIVAALSKDKVETILHGLGDDSLGIRADRSVWAWWFQVTSILVVAIGLIVAVFKGKDLVYAWREGNPVPMYAVYLLSLVVSAAVSLSFILSRRRLPDNLR